MMLRSALVGFLAAGALAAAGTVSLADSAWIPVEPGTTGGVSGLAPASSGWVLVHDNKKAGQNRVSLLSGAGVVTRLTWPGAQPNDLESIAAVPDHSGQYVAVASTGQGTVFTISGTSIDIQRTVTLPRGQSGIESFALTRDGATTIAIWATRGSSSSAARVWASTFSADTGSFGKIVTGRVSVPYPTRSVRQLADLVVSGGRLVGSSTSDPGASGPFASAIYELGSVDVVSGRAVLHLLSPVSLGTFAGHKIEAIACSGPTGLLGSDDEKQGGWVAAGSMCG